MSSGQQWVLVEMVQAFYEVSSRGSSAGGRTGTPAWGAALVGLSLVFGHELSGHKFIFHLLARLCVFSDGLKTPRLHVFKSWWIILTKIPRLLDRSGSVTNFRVTYRLFPRLVAHVVTC